MTIAAARVLFLAMMVLEMASIRNAVTEDWNWMLLTSGTAILCGLAATSALWKKE